MFFCGSKSLQPGRRVSLMITRDAGTALLMEVKINKTGVRSAGDLYLLGTHIAKHELLHVIFDLTSLQFHHQKAEQVSQRFFVFEIIRTCCWYINHHFDCP